MEESSQFIHSFIHSTDISGAPTLCQVPSWTLEIEQGAAQVRSDRLPVVLKLISYSGGQLIKKSAKIPKQEKVRWRQQRK